MRVLVLILAAVLLKPDGEIAWYLLDQHRITSLAPSFSLFLHECAECYDRYSSLDYYHWIDMRKNGE